MHDICMYVIMKKWTCIESNIWIMDEYGFSIMSAWRNHNQKLPYDLGGATKIGSSVRGGRETGKIDAWFSSYLHLYNLEFLWWMQLH
jgi:hypothetical protein